MFSAGRCLMARLRREVLFLTFKGRHTSATRTLSQAQPEQKRDLQSDQQLQEDQQSQQDIDIEQIKRKYMLEPISYTVDDFGSIINNEKEAKRVHLILLELESLRAGTGQAPCVVNKKDMLHLMDGQSKSYRQRHLHNMFLGEMRKLRLKVTKEIGRIEREATPKKPTRMVDAIYPIIRYQQEALFLNSRLAIAAQFGQKLVFDCGFEAHMNRRQMSTLGIQLRLAYSINKGARDPFDLFLSGIQKGGILDKVLDLCFANLNSSNCLLTKSYDSYLDMFPDKRILYLTPNSQNIIEEWDPEAVIIIGALVDKADGRALSLAKAKRLGIEHGKLPIGLYLPMFRPNTSVSLPLPSVVDILLTLKETNDWSQALLKFPKKMITVIEKLQSQQRPKAHKPGWKLQESSSLDDN